MADIVLNESEPTVEQVRQWGYKEDVLFIEQDEDLILQELKYVPVLLALANDPECPKNDYALGILQDLGQSLVAYRQKPEAAALADTLEAFSAPMRQELGSWLRIFKRMHGRLAAPKLLSKPEGQELAFDLLVGPNCHRELECTGAEADGFVEYHAFTQSYHLFLYLNHATGIWEPPVRTRRPEVQGTPYTIRKISGGSGCLEDIQRLETLLGHRLPEDYRLFLMATDGGGLDPSFQYYPIPGFYQYGIHITDFWSAHELPEDPFSLAAQLAEQKKRFPDWPGWLLPIGRSGLHSVALAIAGPERGAVFFTGEKLEDLYKLSDTFEQFYSSLTSLEECSAKLN